MRRQVDHVCEVKPLQVKFMKNWAGCLTTIKDRKMKISHQDSTRQESNQYSGANQEELINAIERVLINKNYKLHPPQCYFCFSVTYLLSHVLERKPNRKQHSPVTRETGIKLKYYSSLDNKDELSCFRLVNKWSGRWREYLDVRGRVTGGRRKEVTGGRTKQVKGGRRKEVTGGRRKKVTGRRKEVIGGRRK